MLPLAQSTIQAVNKGNSYLVVTVSNLKDKINKGNTTKGKQTPLKDKHPPQQIKRVPKYRNS